MLEAGKHVSCYCVPCFSEMGRSHDPGRWSLPRSTVAINWRFFSIFPINKGVPYHFHQFLTIFSAYRPNFFIFFKVKIMSTVQLFCLRSHRREVARVLLMEMVNLCLQVLCLLLTLRQTSRKVTRPVSCPLYIVIRVFFVHQSVSILEEWRWMVEMRGKSLRRIYWSSVVITSHLTKWGYTRRASSWRGTWSGGLTSLVLCEMWKRLS